MENISWRQDLPQYLTPRITKMLLGLPKDVPVEEIRIRAGQPLQVCLAGEERMLVPPDGRAAATSQECGEMLLRICGHSLYAWSSELKNGFITLTGGYRVGICGKAVIEGDRMARFSDVTSFDIRIPHMRPGAADHVLPYLLDTEGRAVPSLLVSAPGCGKTTMLRDIARQLSVGQHGAKAHRVAVVDSRYELSGGGAFDLGPRTDVLSGLDRREGLPMLLRTMAPEVIVTDEIGVPADAHALFAAATAGVCVIASLHATYAARERNTLLMKMRQEGVFLRFVYLGRSHGAGTVEHIERVTDATERMVSPC